MSIQDEIALIEAEAELLFLATDTESSVPANASRSRTSEEIESKANFAEIEQEEHEHALAIAALLVLYRKQLFGLLRAHLRKFNTADQMIEELQRLPVIGLSSIEGAPELFNSSAALLRDELVQGSIVSAARLRDEIQAQGVVAPVLTQIFDDTNLALDHQANRLAIRPQIEAVLAAAEAVVEFGSLDSSDNAFTALTQIEDTLSENVLRSYAMQGAVSAVGLGRLAQLTIAPAGYTAIASEILDRSICGPCRKINGTKYRSVDAMRRDYLFGIYKRCEGGLKCRGIPVVIYRRR